MLNCLNLLFHGLTMAGILHDCIVFSVTPLDISKSANNLGAVTPVRLTADPWSLVGTNDMTFFAFLKTFTQSACPFLCWQLHLTDGYELVAFALPCLQTLSKDHIA